MDCQKCTWYKTVSELLWTSFKTFKIDLECKNKLPTLNKALAHLWSYAFLLPWFKVSEMVDVTQVNHTTCERIYMPVWFYGKWCWNCFITTDDQCLECCADGYQQINMSYKESVPFIWNAQYTIQCPLSNNVQYNLPSWTESAYFTYYRYFNKPVDENSLVEIPEYLEPALEMLIAYNSWEIDTADKASIWEDFVNYMKQQFEAFKMSKQVPSKINFKLFT